MMLKTHNSNLVIRPSTAADIDMIAAEMRQADRDEIWASHALTARPALEIGLKDSHACLTAVFNGRPIAMFGAVEDADDSTAAIIWMLGSRYVDLIPLSFVKASRLMIDRFHAAYETLYNHIDVRSKRSVLWLKAIGATFQEPAPYGPFGYKFMRFELRRGEKCALQQHS